VARAITNISRTRCALLAHRYESAAFAQIIFCLAAASTAAAADEPSAGLIQAGIGRCAQEALPAGWTDM